MYQSLCLLNLLKLLQNLHTKENTYLVTVIVN